MGGADVQVQVRQGGGHVIEQAGPIKARDLDDRVAVRQIVIHHQVRRQGEGLVGAARLLAAGLDRIAQAHLPAQRLFDGLRHPISAAQLILVLLEGAADEDRVQGQPVRGGEDLGVHDIGARRRASARDDRQEAGMVGGYDRQFRHAAKGVGGELGHERFEFDIHDPQQFGVGDLVLQIRLQPIGLIVTRRIGVEIGIRPGGQRLAQFVLRHGDALFAVDGRVAARQHHFCLPIEGAQQLALPAVPDPRAHSAGVADRQHQQHAQALEGLRDGGEGLDGAGV